MYNTKDTSTFKHSADADDSHSQLSMLTGRVLVSSPDPTHKMGKGLVTFEPVLACAESAKVTCANGFCKKIPCKC